MRAPALVSCRPSAAMALVGDGRGAIFVEYLVVVGVGLVVATALSAVGAAEVSSYSNARAILSTENP
jgi:hypothetical protein